MKRFVVAVLVVCLTPQLALAAPTKGYYSTNHYRGTPAIMSAPTFKSSFFGIVRKHVKVECQTVGQPNLGSKVWNKISYPQPGYMLDVFVDTPGHGRFSSSIPKCVGPREKKALAWANAQLHQAKQANGNWWAKWCEKFSANAYGRSSSGYANANAHYLSLKKRGLIYTDSDPMPGALVFYKSQYGGHVAIALGDGHIITTPLHAGSGIYKTKLLHFPDYLGWAFAPTNW